MQRIGMLTLNVRLTTRVNHYLSTRLSNQKELENEYIATEAEALREVCGFCSRNYFKVDVLKRGSSAAKGTICKK